MKGLASAPGDYVYFKSQVPLHKISIGSKQWRYYDFGPKSVPPLICLPGIAGTADVYYKQIMSLSLKGYRVISVDLPRVWNHLEWVHAFEKFLDTINVHHVHLYGTSLGGFLAQIFAQYRPRRVKSLVLSNTFLDTEKFSASMPWSPVVGWTPSFLLKRYILTGIRDGPQEPFIADSVDFVVGQGKTNFNLAACSHLKSVLLCQSVVHYEKRTRHSFVNERFRDHVTVNFARSGGPGGQNVNKVNTKVDMRFNVNKAQWLGERVRERILQTEKNRINKDGDLVISSTKTRTQKGNIEDALSKLQEIIDSASYVPPPPSEEQKKRIQKLAAIEEQKRMQNKRALSQKKAIRRTRDSWD